MLQRPSQSMQALPARKLLWFKLDGQAGAAQHVQIGTDVQITRELTVAMRQGTSQHADCRCIIAVDAVSSRGGSSAMTFHSGLQVSQPYCTTQSWRVSVWHSNLLSSQHADMREHDMCCTEDHRSH